MERKTRCFIYWLEAKLRVSPQARIIRRLERENALGFTYSNDLMVMDFQPVVGSYFDGDPEKSLSWYENAPLSVADPVFIQFLWFVSHEWAHFKRNDTEHYDGESSEAEANRFADHFLRWLGFEPEPRITVDNLQHRSRE